MLVFHSLALLPLPDKAQRSQLIEGKAAAVAVDMQPVYLSFINNGERAKEMKNILKTLAFCHERGIPIFALEIKGVGRTTEVLKDKLDEYDATYIFKEDNSGFVNTDLNSRLKSLGIKTLILMGVNASICVKATAEDAMELGYEICTSKQLIAEPYQWRPGIRTYESIPWFIKNGVYCDRYDDLLYVISNSYNRVELPAQLMVPAGF